MKTRKSTEVKAVESQHLGEIERRLRDRYGQPRHHNPLDPLDDLIFLVLSRMTQEVKYLRTYRGLRDNLPTWGAVMDAPTDDLENLLQDAGLAPTKSRQIQAILKEVESREGALDLRRLRGLSDHEVEAYHTLGRDVFPVDAHVWRVLRRLGVAPDRPWSERNVRGIAEGIPRRLRGSLHVTLIAHGRSICRARHPRCAQCVLATVCRSAGHFLSQDDQ